jgi:tRNA threonylcarbamoyladenosine biosynthesis protein TsaB
MVTLAVDTSHPTGAVSLARDKTLLGTKQFAQPASHLVALSQSVEELLSGASLGARDVTRVAVVVGPGSFTGLRIGLAFAKGLHAAGGADLVTIDSLRLLALPLLVQHARVCVMIDARRGEVDAALHARATGVDAANPAATQQLVAPCALASSALFAALPETPDAFVGSGVVAARDEIHTRFPAAVMADPSHCFPDTAWLARLAPAMPALDEAAVRALEPTYVRPSGAERVRLRTHGGGHTPDGSDHG